ncbi:MAG: YtxH domain-containing protein [Thiohalocapsa sp.]
MFLPIIPVLIGAAVGVAGTYVIMDKSFRKRLSDSVHDLGDTVQSRVKHAKHGAAEIVDHATDAAKDAAPQ